MNNKTKLSFVIAFALGCIVTATLIKSQGATQGHDVSEIRPGATGTFAPGNYNFPSNLNVGGDFICTDCIHQGDIANSVVTNAKISEVDWVKLQNYPAGCVAGQFVTGVGDTLICAATPGGIGGSGTDNYIPRWSGISNLENSVIYQTDAGNVGIGTNNPGINLHVYGSNSEIFLQRGDNANYAAFDAVPAGATSASNVLWQAGLYPNRNNYEIWSYYEGGGDSPTRFSITNIGNVGIGTTGPTQKLDVDGNIRVRDIANCLNTFSGTDPVTGYPTGGVLSTDASGNMICVPAIIYSGAPCLEEGSLVLTPEGFKPIETLNVGDIVIGYKEGRKIEAKIKKTSVHDGEWTLYNYKGYWFTGNHRVYIDYEHLEEVSKLSDVTKEYVGKVYDIKVEETENYFGENGLLIHNK